MKAFLVHVNGQRICPGGVGDNGVMGVAVDWVGGTGLDGKPKTRRLNLTVGGLDSMTREHLLWRTPQLEVGDTITIQVVETNHADPEFRRYRPEAKPGDDDLDAE